MVADLANLKIIPTEKLSYFIFGIKVKATTESLGYSSNVLESLGLIFFAVLLILILIAVILVLSRLIKSETKIGKCLQFLKKKLVFNSVLRTGLATYLVILISSLMAVKSYDFSNLTSSLLSVLVIF